MKIMTNVRANDSVTLNFKIQTAVLKQIIKKKKAKNTLI